MAAIDADGMFYGDRMAKLSLMARLYWSHFYVASNGYARIEINYPKLVSTVFSTFPVAPSKQELMGYIKEYHEAFLLFVYRSNGQIWGQWCTSERYLPYRKTKKDEASPAPNGTSFEAWKKRYLDAKTAGIDANSNGCNFFENSKTDLENSETDFQNSSHGFGSGVGSGVGIGNGSIPKPLTPPSAAVVEISVSPKRKKSADWETKQTPEQQVWFAQFWSGYWLKKSKQDADDAFEKKCRSPERFAAIMAALKAQSLEMLRRESHHRPQAASWLNGGRWTDEVAQCALELTAPIRLSIGDQKIAAMRERARLADEIERAET